VIGHFGNDLCTGLSKTPLRTWINDNIRYVDAITVEFMRKEHNGFGRVASWASDVPDMAAMVHAAHNNDQWPRHRASSYAGQWYSGLCGTLKEVLPHAAIGDKFVLALAKTKAVTAAGYKELAAAAKLHGRDATLLEAVATHYDSIQGSGDTIFALMRCAIGNGDHALLKWAIKAGADVNAGLYTSRKPLSMAVQKLDATSVKILLDAKASLTTTLAAFDAVNANRNTDANVSAVRALLVEAGAE
jgi:hypothetical protein